MKRLLAMFLLPFLFLQAQDGEAERRIQQEIKLARQNLTEMLETNLSEKKTLVADLQESSRKRAEALASAEKLAGEREGIEGQILQAEEELARLREIQQRTEQIIRDFNAMRSGEMPLPELFPALQEELRFLVVPHFTEGSALDERGREHQGRFAVVGPARFFRSRDGSLIGPVAMRPNCILPTVLEHVTPAERNELAKLFDQSEAIPPTDLTQGRAFSLRTAQDSWLRHLAKGGPLMIPILVLAVLCLIIAILKLCQLAFLPNRASLECIDRLVLAALDGKNEEAKKVADGLPGTLQAMGEVAIAHRELDEEHLEALLYEATLAPQSRLERYLGLLAISASAAPLLGLLGTVTGMIHTFQLITLFGTGDARLLSGGISEALITTEAGLMVAIPALVIHAWCNRRAKHHDALCRETALRLLKLCNRRRG